MGELTEIGPVRPRRGALVTGKWPLIELDDGSAVDVPVAVLQGLEPGATLWVLTGIHGNEYVGLGAIQQLLRSIDPEELRGALVAIPAVNVLAYRLRERSAYIDGMDMNRIWPGAPIGEAMHLFGHSEVVVSRLIQPILETADFAIDCHDGSDIAICAPYACFSSTTSDDELNKRLRDAAVASGLRVLWEQSSDFAARQQPSTASYTLTRHGIPCLLFESGGTGQYEEGVQVMYAAIRGVMGHLGMLPSDKASPSSTQVRVSDVAWLRAGRGGFYSPCVPVLSEVAEGQLIASIIDFFGDTKQELVTPHDAIIMTQRTHGPVNEGEFVCEIGRL